MRHYFQALSLHASFPISTAAAGHCDNSTCVTSAAALIRGCYRSPALTRRITAINEQLIRVHAEHPLTSVYSSGFRLALLSTVTAHIHGGRRAVILIVWSV